MMPEPTELFYNTILARLTFLEGEVKRLNEAKDAPTDASLFERVMTISPAYVARFGGQLTESGTVAKFDEEYREFKECIDELVIFNDETRQHLLEEFVDMNVTAGGVFAFYGVRWEEIEQAARATLAKLDKRTPETHAWNPETMTVERIGKIAK